MQSQRWPSVTRITETPAPRHTTALLARAIPMPSSFARRTALATVATAALLTVASVSSRSALPDASAAPVAASFALAPVHFTIDPVHSQVMFKVKHLGLSTVTGNFGKFTGSFMVDSMGGPADIAVTIETASINTNIEGRDSHLRSSDFFAADSFPTISYRATRLERVAGGKYRVLGELTMRGVTKPVVLDAELQGARKGPQGWTVGVNAMTTVNRKDYGLQWSRMTEGVAVVSDDVQVILELEARETEPAATIAAPAK